MTSRVVPLGRLAEALAGMERHETLSTESLPGAFGDVRIRRWPSRAFLARAVRTSEAGSPVSKIRPVVALAIGEGY